MVKREDGWKNQELKNSGKKRVNEPQSNIQGPRRIISFSSNDVTYGARGEFARSCLWSGMTRLTTKDTKSTKGERGMGVELFVIFRELRGFYSDGSFIRLW